jgi:hypothetical protein
MMSSWTTRVTRPNVCSFVAHTVAEDDRVAEIDILDDTLKRSVLRKSLRPKGVTHVSGLDPKRRGRGERI